MREKFLRNRSHIASLDARWKETAAGLSLTWAIEGMLAEFAHRLISKRVSCWQELLREVGNSGADRSKITSNPGG